MKKILVIGAGRSSPALIDYLLQHAAQENWFVRVGDFSGQLAESRVKNHAYGEGFRFDINDEAQRSQEISNSDMVVSLLPPDLHLFAAKDCVRHQKNLVTASYVSPAIAALHEDAEAAGVLLLNECGLDPGIDHMSAMQIIHRLKSENAELSVFKSYTGGLIAPESNDNPWGYKFTWNPRNVILAGQGTARFIRNHKLRFIPYSRIFTDIEKIHVDGAGTFDGYSNRDSLAYRFHYEIENIPTLLRGTLRNEGFCDAWNIFVQLGLTDDSFIIENAGSITYADFVNSFIPPSIKGSTLKERVAELCRLQTGSEALKKVEWTGIFSNEKINLPKGTPAQILQDLLEKKWVLKPDDKDMIIMQHVFEYNPATDQHSVCKLISSLVVKGDDHERTAMAKTVGLPMAMAAHNILNGKIKLSGVKIPVMPEVYIPVLEGLKKAGIIFNEKVSVN